MDIYKNEFRIRTTTFHPLNYEYFVLTTMEIDFFLMRVDF
jgi:hypothetical protein